jgi:hypothetical protein
MMAVVDLSTSSLTEKAVEYVSKSSCTGYKMDNLPIKSKILFRFEENTDTKSTPTEAGFLLTN